MGSDMNNGMNKDINNGMERIIDCVLGLFAVVGLVIVVVFGFLAELTLRWFPLILITGVCVWFLSGCAIAPVTPMPAGIGEGYELSKSFKSIFVYFARS